MRTPDVQTSSLQNAKTARILEAQRVWLDLKRQWLTPDEQRTLTRARARSLICARKKKARGDPPSHSPRRKVTLSSGVGTIFKTY